MFHPQIGGSARMAGGGFGGGGCNCCKGGKNYGWKSAIVKCVIVVLVVVEMVASMCTSV